MIQSVSRALTLLHTVAASESCVGVRELARRTGLKVPTAQHLLKTLEAHGYLEFDESSRGYRIGLTPLLLAESADPLQRLRELGLPYVNRLLEELGETMTLAACRQEQILCLYSRQPQQQLAATPPPRVYEHPHCLASGILLLAFQSDAVQKHYAAREPLAKLGSNLPRTQKALLQVFAEARAQGFAEAINVRDSGIGAIAVPVFDAHGRAVLALACSVPLARLPERRHAQIRKRLLAVAAEMTAALRGQAERT